METGEEAAGTALVGSSPPPEWTAHPAMAKSRRLVANLHRRCSWKEVFLRPDWRRRGMLGCSESLGHCRPAYAPAAKLHFMQSRSFLVGETSDVDANIQDREDNGHRGLKTSTVKNSVKWPLCRATHNRTTTGKPISKCFGDRCTRISHHTGGAPNAPLEQESHSAPQKRARPPKERG